MKNKGPYRDLDTEAIELIKQHISRGTPRKIAVIASGVDPSAFNKAWHDGSKYPERSPWTQMVAEITVAEANAVSDMVQTAVPKGDAESARWFLERTTKHFQPKVSVALDGQANAIIERLEHVLPPEMFEKALNAIASIDEEDVLEGIVVDVKRLKEGEQS